MSLQGFTLTGTGSTAYSGAITITSPMITEVISTGSGVEARLEGKKVDTGISPRLYFRFIKAKFSKLEKGKLRTKVVKLQTLVSRAKEFQQQALYEKLSEMIAVTVRELEAVTLGIDTYILKKDVEKYREQVSESAAKGGRDKVSVFFKPLAEFPRIIPKEPGNKINRVKDLKLFDNYHVLYLDYSKEELKTNAKKVREKDPIVFGSYAYAPDNLYYICDWQDKFCDLTIDKLVDTLRLSDKDFALSKTPEFNAKFFERIKNEVLERHERLSSTNKDNWRDQEQKAKDAEKQRRRRSWRFWKTN